MTEVKEIDLTEAAEVLGKRAYETYNKAVGGKAYNGDPLPSWEAFKADASKEKQYNAWLAVGADIAEYGFSVEKACEDGVDVDHLS